MRRLGTSIAIIISTVVLSAVHADYGSRSLTIERYHNNSSVQWCWALETLLDYDVDSSDRILDVGCADGKISSYLASRTPHGCVVGIDPLQECVDFASATYPSTQHSNLSFCQTSIEDLGESNTYDLVTAFCAFNWIDDKEPALRAVYDALVPGGRALIIVPASFDPAVDEYFGGAASACGFITERFERIRTSVVFPGKDDVLRWLCAIRASLAELSPEDQARFLEQHLERVEALYPQAADGRVYAFPEKLVVELRKPLA